MPVKEQLCHGHDRLKAVGGIGTDADAGQSPAQFQAYLVSLINRPLGFLAGKLDLIPGRERFDPGSNAILDQLNQPFGGNFQALSE
ncbi:hypothetical protein LB542_20425 [Mesorhizobium sp. BR1-1-9]|uniref:hypothetical protein n=1 Tax=unclassified Mesorhizobium TaxID=325217 RepID=UPI001CD076B5|nr:MULTISPECIES: hypothetical protein [unclassified Mesorhizobium]MBZ9873212.1 hypothetical protein [Mesorhizobium sp. BR1-1-9]MBZ9944977.1 hypothetical protein [Mesorhizobium sp. BR1-1-13]